MVNFLKRKNVLRLVYSIILVVILYYLTSFFAALSIHGEVQTDVFKISAGVDGYIQRVYVNDNQLVRKGQLLMGLDPTPYQLNVDSANSIYQQAQIQIDLAKDNYEKIKFTVDSAQKKSEQTRRTYLRYQSLLESRAISANDFEQVRLKNQMAEDELKSAQLQLQTAENNINLNQKMMQQKQSDLNQAKYEFSLTKIVAPQTGYISNLNYYGGDYVKKGDMLFGLIDRNAWRVDGYYFEDEIANMKPGQKVFVRLASDPWKLHWGRITSISRGVARESHSDNVSLPYQEPVMGWFTNKYYYSVRIKLNSPENLPLFVGANAYTLVIY